MNLDERRKALLRLVQEYRDRECRRILADARKEAAELRRQSFHKQRALLHSRIVAEQSRARVRIQAARAERATQGRWASEKRNLELLQAAWPLVRERLVARWRVSEQRRRWTETYLRRALDLLPGGRWTIRHAPEWCDRERREALAELTEVLGQPPRFQSEEGMEAGLIIESGAAALDASLRGLLQDRAGLEARLLALVAGRARS
jgi:hypothetical protein